MKGKPAGAVRVDFEALMRGESKGVVRMDFAQITAAEMLPSGFLRFEAVLGRVGIFKYSVGGKSFRDLRPHDAVFDSISLESARAAVVTDKHPPRADAWINPNNWRKYQVGFTDGVPVRDGDRVLGAVVIQDAAMIELIERGERREISPVYVVLDYDETPGRWNGKEYGPHVTDGEPYDRVQRGIVYNSIGIGPTGWGRQGGEVSLVLDSAADDLVAASYGPPANKLGNFIAQQMNAKGMTVLELATATGIILPADQDYDGEPKDPLLRTGSTRGRTCVLEDILNGYTDRPSDEQLKAIAAALDIEIDTLIRQLPEQLVKLDEDEPPAPPTNPEKPRMEETELNIDGVTIKLPKDAAQIVAKALAERDAKIAEGKQATTDAEAATTEQEARADGLQEQLTKIKGEFAEAPAKYAAAAKARATLEADARRVLGDEIVLDGKTDNDVRKAVIGHVWPALVLDGKDETYVQASYDNALLHVGDAANARVTGAALGSLRDRPPVLDSDDDDDESDVWAARERLRKGSRATA